MYMSNLKERKECQGVYLEEDNVPILEVGRMKTEDKMCSLEKIRLQCFLLKFSRYRYPRVRIL